MIGGSADRRAGRALTVFMLLTAYASRLTAQSDPRVDSVFATLARSDGPGCVAGVRQDGATVHLKAYGMANLEYGVPLSTESISESGSVAKQFTAASLVLLAQAGKLSLDDDIRKYLPEVPDFGHVITIRHLLTHTSGLRDQWALLSLAGWPPGTQVHSIPLILDLVSRQRMLNFEPGRWYLYSNTGYALAGAIVQRVTGQPLADWSREHLFRPLGMEHTQWRDDFRKVVPGRATAYSPISGGWLQDMPFTKVYGNGGLLTTVPDLLRWNDALSAGTAPLTPAVVRTLETPGRLSDGTTLDYALGLGVTTWRGVREVTHGGATAGYRTYLARWPDRKLSVAILCNAGNVNPDRFARQIAQRLLGLPTEDTPPAPGVSIAADALAPLVGRWRDSMNDRVLTARVEQGRLGVRGGGPPAMLTPLGNGRFWSAQTGELRFEGTRMFQTQGGVHEYARDDIADTTGVKREELVGLYRSDELLVTYRVAIKDGQLTMHLPPDDPSILVPLYRDGFDADGTTIRVLRDGSGRVAGLRVYAGRALDVRFQKLQEGERP